MYLPVHLFSGILNIFEFSLNNNCYASITLINADFLSEGFHFKTVLWKDLILRQYVRKERWSLIFNHLEIYRRKLGIRWVGWAPCWNDLALQEQPFFKTTSKKSSIPVLPQHLIALEEPSSFPLHFFSCSDSWGSILLPGCTEVTSISKKFILWIYGKTFKNTRKPNFFLAIVKPQKFLIMLLQIGMVMFEFSVTSLYFQNYMHICFHFTVHTM